MAKAWKYPLPKAPSTPIDVDRAAEGWKHPLPEPPSAPIDLDREVGHPQRAAWLVRAGKTRQDAFKILKAEFPRTDKANIYRSLRKAFTKSAAQTKSQQEVQALRDKFLQKENDGCASASARASMLHKAAVPKEDALKILFAEFPTARKANIRRSWKRARSRRTKHMKQRRPVVAKPKRARCIRAARMLNMARSKRRQERRQMLEQEREEHDIIMPRELRRMAEHDRYPSSYWSLVRRDDSGLFTFPEDEKEWQERKKMAGHDKYHWRFENAHKRYYGQYRKETEDDDIPSPVMVESVSAKTFLRNAKTGSTGGKPLQDDYTKGLFED